MTSRSFSYVVAAGGLVALTALAFAVGRYPVSLPEIWSLLASKLTGSSSTLPANVETVVLQVRGPRVLAALVVGAALAAAGTAYQGMFRNPLVSPDILGVSTGAALGAVLAIFFSQGILVIQLFAFTGGLAAVGLVYWIGSRLRGHDPLLALVLTGVVIGTLLGSVIALLKYLADPYNQLPAITYWLLGSLAAIAPRDLGAAAPLALAGLAPMLLLRWRMNLLALPDDEARALGVNVGTLRIAVIAAATLMTSAAVAIAGADLVQQHDLGIGHHGAAELEQLFLPTGEIAGELEAQRPELEAAQHLFGAFAEGALLRFHPRGTEEGRQQMLAALARRHDHEVLQHGHAGELMGDLEGAHQPPMEQLMGPPARDILAVELDAAGIRRHESGQHVEQRGLPRAIGADQPQDLAALHRQAAIGHGTDTAEGFADVMRRDHAAGLGVMGGAGIPRAASPPP